jgi:hypothetical protein
MDSLTLLMLFIKDSHSSSEKLNRLNIFQYTIHIRMGINISNASVKEAQQDSANRIFCFQEGVS